MNAVFPEVGVSPALEQAISDETGAEIGGELYADTLGPAGSDVDTYLGALAANTATFVDGFTGGRLDCARRPSHQLAARTRGRCRERITS